MSAAEGHDYSLWEAAIPALVRAGREALLTARHGSAEYLPKVCLDNAHKDAEIVIRAAIQEIETIAPAAARSGAKQDAPE